VNGTIGHRFQLVNEAGTPVVTYDLPLLQSELAPGKNIGYSISFTSNSTFTGTYIYGVLLGNDTIYGFAGNPATVYYSLFQAGATNKVTVTYLVPEASSGPYIIGVANPFGSTQGVTVSSVSFASCGNTWISRASVI
jgi:hypothetical protein